MKKTLVIAIALIMLASMLFTGCQKSEEPSASKAQAETESKTDDKKEQANPEGPIFMAPALPITNEPITVELLINGPDKVIDMNTNEVTLYLEELTGLDINWNVIPQGDSGKEKINLMLAAQADLPDAFWTYANTISLEQVGMYGANGTFIAWDEYLDDYAPNYKMALERDPMVRPQIAIDGKLYGAFHKKICTHCLRAARMWINQEWLANLGLKMPTTTDELYDVLVAFKENDANGNGDPNDEIPMGAITQKWHDDLFTFLMNSWLPTTEHTNYTYTYLEDGTIKMGATDDRFKEGLKFFRKLYKEGLLDEECFTMQSAQMKQITGNEGGNRLGSIPVANTSTFVDVTVDGLPEQFTPIPPLAGPNGEQGTPYFEPSAGLMTIITNQAEYPEAIIRLADLYLAPYYEDDETTDLLLDIQYGPNGWRKAEEGEIGLDGTQAYMAWTLQFAEPTNKNFANNWPTWPETDLKTHMVAVTGDLYDFEKVVWDASTIAYKPYEKKIVVPPLVIASESAAEYSEYKTLISDHIDLSLAQFVKGERDIDAEWDAYVAELEAYGLSEFLRLKQEAYDAAYK